MDWIKNRLQEPSTWAGLSALFMGGTFLENTGAEFGPEFWSALGVVVTALVAVIKKSPNADKDK